MAYKANLSGNQQLIVVNQGTLTSITLTSSSPGQQQSSSNSFTTGNWTSAPQLYKTGSGFILEVNGDRKKQSILIQANSISTVAAPALDNAVKIDLENTSDTSVTQKNREYEPMQTMKMGNRSLDIHTMSMKMGNMSLDMEGKKATSTKRFCSQCGEKVKNSDRFCSSCGHLLDN